MKQHSRGAWRDRLRTAVWGVAVAVLAGVLASEAWRARGEVRSLARQRAALEARLREDRARNGRLRAELEALEHDPVYVESLLRRWKMNGEPGR